MAADFENGKFKPLEEFINTMSEEEDEDNKAEESTEGHEYKFFGCAGENNFLIGDNVYIFLLGIMYTCMIIICPTIPLLLCLNGWI